MYFHSLITSISQSAVTASMFHSAALRYFSELGEAQISTWELRENEALWCPPTRTTMCLRSIRSRPEYLPSKFNRRQDTRQKVATEIECTRLPTPLHMGRQAKGEACKKDLP